ncbi:MAG: iron ABC transporter substrate-binding protein [Hyphomicrobiales bacterium]|mgnify:FL=1|nr:MAG: iron ABC transporter substrate-binding protein [Hyphomicrobiales bacterium]
MKSYLRIVLGALMLGGVLTSAVWAETRQINLYSYRQPFLIQPLLEAFTAQSGIKVNVVFARKGMLERIKAEGANSPADAVLTVDIGRLSDMVDAGVLAPVKSKVLEANIPAAYRHPQGLWFGLTTRARILFVSKDRVKPGEVASYENLADPKLKGRVCIRSGKHLYNISLLASIILHKGEAAAESWLRGLKANLARKPQGNDRAQAKAVYEGVCDVGIANTYYMGKMQTNDKKPEQKAWAEAVRVVFPNQAGRGTHVNISGAAVLKGSKRKADAIRLIEYLSSAPAQKIYAEQNFEYPVKAGVKLHPLVKSWGDFTPDSANLSQISAHRAEAARLIDKTGFDH